jgi:hypothetical protein
VKCVGASCWRAPARLTDGQYPQRAVAMSEAKLEGNSQSKECQEHGKAY